MRERLSDSEIDNLRRRVAIHLCDQNVRWLQIAVDNRFLMRVLDSFADMHEQFQPIARIESVIVAVGRDGNAGDILHDEVRPSLRRGTRVEHLGDSWVVHQGQSLALGLEARHHLARVHARLDQLDGDAPANRLLLLG